MPTRFVYLDSEAHQAQERTHAVQTFRLAVAAFDERNGTDNTWSDREWGEFYDTDALWEWIASKCKAKYRTVVVAHKMDYDLRITNGLQWLSANDWRCEWVRISDRGMMGVFRKGGRSLHLVDSLSWVSQSLEAIGKLIGLPKLDLPAWEDSNEAWLARCTRDVEILATFYRQLMEWVKADDLGNWKPTGAGQSWAAFRHRFMSERIEVHHDEDAHTAEIAAAHTGRCEAWRYGKLTGGPFYEWDFTAAYARIGAECAVPSRFKYELAPKAFGHVLQRGAQWATLAECTITTDAPTVPCRYDGRILWPVGTFRTTLWDNELRLAIEHGATVDMHRAWRYQRRNTLREFCTWCLDVIEERTHDHSPLQRAVVKHWSRALIGRFAMRTSQWDEFGTAPWADVSLNRALDGTTGERFTFMHLGTQMMRQGPEQLGPQTVPSIMSWIMAESRVRLWRAALCAGFENVAYLDTDSLIVGRAGHERLRAAAVPGFRVKARADNLEVIGPRRYVMSGRLRASGVPSNAVRVGYRVWEAEVWHGLSRSLLGGNAGQVVITPRTIRLADHDERRQRREHGGSAPRRVRVN